MEEARGSFPGLLDSPIPRPLQWDWSIGVIAALIVLFAWLPIWDLVHSQYYFAATGRISGLEQGAGIAVAVYFFLLPALSRQRLLRYGGVAVGRVVHQELVQQNSSSIKSVIFYAFLDGSRILRWSAEIGMVLLELYQVRGSLAVEVMLTFHHRDVTQSKHRFQNFEREGLA